MNAYIELIKPLTFVLVSSGITLLLNEAMKKRGFKVNALANHLLTAFISFSLYLSGGISIWTVKGIALAFILLYASIQDISTRESDDWLWVMILLLCLADFGKISPMSMLLGGVAVFVPQMAIAVFGRTDSIGGADIKVSTAAALLLGFTSGVISYAAGLAFAIVFQTVNNKVRHKNNKGAFALLPFISAGFMIGYFFT